MNSQFGMPNPLDTTDSVESTVQRGRTRQKKIGFFDELWAELHKHTSPFPPLSAHCLPVPPASVRMPLSLDRQMNARRWPLHTHTHTSIFGLHNPTICLAGLALDLSPAHTVSDAGSRSGACDRQLRWSWENALLVLVAGQAVNRSCHRIHPLSFCPADLARARLST